MLNLQLSKAYLLGSAIAKRTWWDAILALTETKFGTNKDRWITAQKDKACQPLWPKRIVETQGEDLLKALRAGCVSTNNHLRRLHNFCVDMNWLPWPLIPKRLALGHNSKAVHRAYARKAQVTLPPLEDYEKNANAAPVIPLPVASNA